jgi:outer membrane murein-binding lipoprotein Lpp
MNKKQGLFLVGAVLLLAVITLAGCAKETKWVDSYTSATSTGTGVKQVLSGADLEAARNELVKYSDDGATLARSRVEGYAPNPNGRVIQALSISPDGTINNSSVGEWYYSKADNTVTLILTHGQTAENYEQRQGGTILIKSDTGFMNYLLVHVRLKDIKKQPFDQAAFDAGNFPRGYSGAPFKLGVDTITLNVLYIELSTLMML